YGRSVEYALTTMFSFLDTYDQPDLVLVVLGDHQPARIVSGAEADHDVPVTIIARDPEVFDLISSWRWEEGVHPSPDAPSWRMDQFRDRFVEAFSG
ncbi:MAG TPA: CDP-alcohol phosphatidyltransferase, partial [Microbacterium sp.]|nr:CDP-alcohol phosphatidyltransferase [Microbacterium sp.]